MPSRAGGSIGAPHAVIGANNRVRKRAARPVAMALTRSLTRPEPPTLQTTGEGMDRESLLALSQRKLNALGLPVCYIDADQRYRFINRAFLDWTGRAQAEVIGRE